MFIRKQILATRGLGYEDFKDVAEATAAADALIQQFQEKYPEKVAEHPNNIFPGTPQLDQFWFAEFKGTFAHPAHRHITYFFCSLGRRGASFVRNDRNSLVCEVHALSPCGAKG